MEKNIAISVKNISKTFKIPHEKVTSIKGAVTSAFKSGGYEEFKALDNVSFEVKKGEFFGIIGRNGSGKSTLLKILAGIYQADTGKVKIDGMISPFLELGIGFNPELSGRDNVYLNATVLGMTKKQIDQKFDSIVKFSELERFIDQKLKNYSSGMQVRLAFSVSIHANRDILLMDEVLAVGDSNFQKKCIDIFRSYRDKNKTVVLVTHDISSVRKYCSRALLLHDGKIAKMGAVDAVCDAYIIKNMEQDSRGKLSYDERDIKNEADREREIRNKMKSKKQMICDLRVVDEDGKELLEITRGDNFVVEVTADIVEVCPDMHLSVQVLDRDSDYFVSGNNSKFEGYNPQWKIGKNKFRLIFSNTDLNEGKIYFRAVLFRGSGDEYDVLDEYSSMDDHKYFNLKRRKSGGGVMYMEHVWEKLGEK